MNRQSRGMYYWIYDKFMRLAHFYEVDELVFSESIIVIWKFLVYIDPHIAEEIYIINNQVKTVFTVRETPMLYIH